MIKMILSILVIFLLSVKVNSQDISSDVYIWKGRTESPAIGTYNVNTLILNSDKTFKILWHRFPSKKFSRIHALLDLKEEAGTYKIEKNILNLYSESKELDIKFLLSRKNRLVPIIEGSKSKLVWKKVH